MAFLGAPLIIPFVFYIPFPGGDTGTGHFSWLSLLLGPLMYSLYALPIAYVAEILLGAPAWMLFRYYRVRSLPAFAAAGALMGWLVNFGMQAIAASLVTKPLAALFNPSDNPYISICVVAGSASAVLFRTIAFWGTPA